MWDDVTITKQCQGCGSYELATVLDIGSAPPPNAMRSLNTHQAPTLQVPLVLLKCGTCALIQSQYVIDPKIVFPTAYPYQSQHSPELHRDFEELASRFDIRPDEVVVDIGANDGTLLSKFPDHAVRVAVEPTAQARRVSGARGIYQEPFTQDLAARMIGGDGFHKATLVTACNVMAHLPDVNDALEGVKALLRPNGVFVAENHDVLSVAGGQWDTIYHEHLRYYSPKTWSELCARHGLYVYRWEPISTHGGSFRAYASADKPPADKARGWELPQIDDMGELIEWELAQKVFWKQRHDLRALIAEIGMKGEEVWGIGATARATAIIHACGFTRADIPLILERDSSPKIDKFVPGTQILVASEKDVQAPPWLLLFSWHMKDRIVPRLLEQGYKGKIIVPLPEVEIIQSAPF